MVELEIGSVSTYATTWTANLNSSTCSAKSQSIYERDLLESELTWFYPNAADTLNPPVYPLPYGQNLKQPGNLKFEATSPLTGVCAINFY
jgi:hypothetical protein